MSKYINSDQFPKNNSYYDSDSEESNSSGSITSRKSTASSIRQLQAVKGNKESFAVKYSFALHSPTDNSDDQALKYSFTDKYSSTDSLRHNGLMVNIAKESATDSSNSNELMDNVSKKLEILLEGEIFNPTDAKLKKRINKITTAAHTLLQGYNAKRDNFQIIYTAVNSLNEEEKTNSEAATLDDSFITSGSDEPSTKEYLLDILRQEQEFESAKIFKNLEKLITTEVKSKITSREDLKTRIQNPTEESTNDSSISYSPMSPDQEVLEVTTDDVTRENLLLATISPKKTSPNNKENSPEDSSKMISGFKKKYNHKNTHLLIGKDDEQAKDNSCVRKLLFDNFSEDSLLIQTMKKNPEPGSTYVSLISSGIPEKNLPGVLMESSSEAQEKRRKEQRKKVKPSAEDKEKKKEGQRIEVKLLFEDICIIEKLLPTHLKKYPDVEIKPTEKFSVYDFSIPPKYRVERKFTTYDLDNNMIPRYVMRTDERPDTFHGPSQKDHVTAYVALVTSFINSIPPIGRIGNMEKNLQDRLLLAYPSKKKNEVELIDYDQDRRDLKDELPETMGEEEKDRIDELVKISNLRLVSQSICEIADTFIKDLNIEKHTTFQRFDPEKDEIYTKNTGYVRPSGEGDSIDYITKANNIYTNVSLRNAIKSQIHPLLEKDINEAKRNNLTNHLRTLEDNLQNLSNSDPKNPDISITAEGKLVVNEGALTMKFSKEFSNIFDLDYSALEKHAVTQFPNSLPTQPGPARDIMMDETLSLIKRHFRISGVVAGNIINGMSKPEATNEGKEPFTKKITKVFLDKLFEQTPFMDLFTDIYSRKNLTCPSRDSFEKELAGLLDERSLDAGKLYLKNNKDTEKETSSTPSKSYYSESAENDSIEDFEMMFSDIGNDYEIYDPDQDYTSMPSLPEPPRELATLNSNLEQEPNEEDRRAFGEISNTVPNPLKSQPPREGKENPDTSVYTSNKNDEKKQTAVSLLRTNTESTKPGAR